MNFSSSPPSLRSPWSQGRCQAEDMNNNLKARPTTMPCFLCKKHLQEDFKKWEHPVQAAAYYHTCSLISMGQLWMKRAANHFHRIYLSTNRDTLPLLWRLIQVCNFPHLHPLSAFCALTPLGCFWNYLITHLAGGCWSHQEALRWSWLYSRSASGALSLPVTHNQTHTRTCIKHRYFFFHERESFSGALLKKMYSILQFCH